MLRDKNKFTFQSCRFCLVGGSLFRVDAAEGTYYVCQGHREEKGFIKVLPTEGVEEEFGEKIGLLTRAINYIKGG